MDLWNIRLISGRSLIPLVADVVLLEVILQLLHPVSVHPHSEQSSSSDLFGQGGLGSTVLGLADGLLFCAEEELGQVMFLNKVIVEPLSVGDEDGHLVDGVVGAEEGKYWVGGSHHVPHVGHQPQVLERCFVNFMLERSGSTVWSEDGGNLLPPFFLSSLLQKQVHILNIGEEESLKIS